MYLANLLELRNRLHLSLEDIAGMLGVTKQCVQQWEKNKIIPNKYAKQLCDVLGIAFEEQETFSPDFIKNFRYKLGMDKKTFSGMLEVNPSSIERWESGKMEMSKNSQLRLHSYYEKFYGLSSK